MIAAYCFLNSSKWFLNKGINLNVTQIRQISLFVFVASCVSMLGRLMSVLADRVFEPGQAVYAELQFTIFLTIALFSLLFFFGTFEKIPSIILKIFKFFAGYSYSLYLTHMPIVLYLYLANPGSDHSPEMFWKAIIISNIVAIIFWWLFERHYVRLAKWAKVKFKKTA